MAEENKNQVDETTEEIKEANEEKKTKIKSLRKSILMMKWIRLLGTKKLSGKNNKTRK